MIVRLMCTVILVLTLTAIAQTPTASDTNNGFNCVQNADGSFNLSWWTSSGFDYYLQQSDDLINWNYVPIVETGCDQPASYGFTSTASASFFRVQYTPSGTMPSDWLAQYGLPSTSGSSDDPSGNGITNQQAFLAGLDPTDYYSGILPGLILSGSQSGTPGQILAIFLSVTVNNGAFGALQGYNAPVTLSVLSGGALLSLDPTGASGWSATINPRAADTIPQGTETPLNGVIAYVLLPNTLGDQSTISASAATAGQTVTVQTQVTTFDGSLAAPTNLTATSIASNAVTLNWTPGNSSLATTLQASFDGGTTWVTVGVAAPGATSATVTGLTSDQQVLFQALTGGESVGASTTFDATSPPPDPLPGQSLSAPTDSASTIPLSQPVLLADQSTGSLHWYGIPGFQDPNNRYLSASQTFTYKTPSFYAGMSDTYTDQIDPITGVDSPTGGSTPHFGSLTDWAQLSEGDGPPSYATIQSDTSANVMAYSYPGSGYSFDGTANLSSPYTFSQFLSNAQTQVPDFSGAYDSAPVATYALTSGDTDVTVQDCSITKLRYKFKVNSNPNLVVCWSVVFTPDDGSTPTTQYMNWASQGATESPVYTIDPSTGTMTQSGGGAIPAAQPATQPPAKPGKTEVKLAVPELQVFDSPGGDMVPSTVPGGQKHFVVPQKSEEFVMITAANLSANDMVLNGGAYSFSGDGQAVDDGGQGLAWSVPTDTPGKYTVNLLQAGSTKPVDTLNVWVVWATGRFLVTPHTVTPTLANTNIGGAPVNNLVMDVDQPWAMVFTIQPADIFNIDQDIPDLAKGVASGLQGFHPIFTQKPLSSGATTHWDVSRRCQSTVANPQLVPLNSFPAGYGTLFANQPQASSIPIPFPSDPFVGNDDAEVIDEINDPYHAVQLRIQGYANNPYTKQVGQVLSHDAPKLELPASGLAVGTSIRETEQFQEFVRLNLNGTWYVISDPLPFTMDFGIKILTGGEVGITQEDPPPQE